MLKRITSIVFICCFIFSIQLVQAQKEYSGTVYANSMQQPLAGVSVSVKGGVGSAVTDKEGNFTLTCYMKKPILIFNYKGLAVQERTYTKRKVEEVMTVPQKYIGIDEKLEDKKNNQVNFEDVFFFNQISSLYIKEDILYSKSKDIIYRDIKAISLVIPPEYFPTGLSKFVITFDFKEVEKFLTPSTETKWVNPFNPLQKSDYVTALKQHWFEPKIEMYRHPINDKQIDLYEDEKWEEFRELYRNQGDLFEDVREGWQVLEANEIPSKPKRIKIPKKTTDLTTLWLLVDLRDSINNSFLAQEREISKLLIEGYLEGKIKGYITDKLDKYISHAELKDRISIPNVSYEEEDSFDGFGDSGEDDDWGGFDDGADEKPKEIAIEKSAEEYNTIQENKFVFTHKEDVSTFSIDVDRASYSNMRRFLNAKQIPPKDAIRIEELVNYFDYDYPKPKGNHPFAIHTEVTKCPWNDKNQLVSIGLQGKEIKSELLPAMNLVFLLDVSGSMNSKNKLSLLKESLKLLMSQLRAKDRVAIVVYAGAAGMVLPSTPATEKDSIIAAFDRLQAGGSTAGGEGILLAYQLARQNFIENGNNRIILATDGDFNVGVSSNDELERLISDQRQSGVFLTVLGFGMGNLKDSKMETLADKGNGNYAYIDNLNEAKKVLVKEFAGTLFAIAKDVKIQIEFNPNEVAAYRLIGYENRVLAKKDFDDDKKDAGELGAGHTVTALYEIVPTGNGLKLPKEKNISGAKTDRLLNVKLRYKYPDEDKSQLLEHEVSKKSISKKASANMAFASDVAQFGMILRDSPFKGNASYQELISAISKHLAKDADAYQKEFEGLVKKCLSILEGVQ